MEINQSKVGSFPMMLLMPAALGLEGIPSLTHTTSQEEHF